MVLSSKRLSPAPVRLKGLRAKARWIRVNCNRSFGMRRLAKHTIAAAACLAFVCNCAEQRRDFLQAPPPTRAGFTHLSLAGSVSWFRCETALQGMDEVVWQEELKSDRVRIYRVRDFEGLDGHVLLAHHGTGERSRLGIEARLGPFGNPEAEERLVNRVAAAIDATPLESSTLIRPPAVAWVLKTDSPLEGRWIDLDGAVRRAGKTKDRVETAIEDTDRWQFATVYSLRMLSGEDGRLVVVGPWKSDAGPEWASIRLGRVRIHERAERAFLDRLEHELNEGRNFVRWRESK